MSLRCVAFVGREPGLAVLRDMLTADSPLTPVRVLTHGRRPRAEGGGPRPELAEFQSLCAASGAPLSVLDLPEARDPGHAVGEAEYDLVVSVSWRAAVPSTILAAARFGGINLHRGALPAYAGEEPVRRALAAEEPSIVITAHAMAAQIDTGAEIARAVLALDKRTRARAASDPVTEAEAVKTRLLPLYAPLLRAAAAARTVW